MRGGSSVGDLMAKLRIYPTITFLVRALRLVVLGSDWRLVYQSGLPIWFTEITVIVIMFHFGGRCGGPDVDINGCE